jgi:hypothetical protein
MNDQTEASLDQLLAGVPRQVAPPRNLWLGIAARIGRGGRRPRPLLLAAFSAAAAACLATLFTWAVLQGRSVPRVIHAVASQGSFDEPRDPNYVLARASAEKTFRERLALLEPGTRSQIEASLAVIRQAHENIRKALDADPQSPLLEQLLESTWHEEFDLYENVVQATQPTMTRI